MNRVYCIAIMSLISVSALAESMRCGDQVIAVGDDKARVLRYCGKPVLKERPQTKTRLSVDAHGEQRRQRVPMERWVYDMPSGQLSRRLVFTDGRVAEIETGDRQ
ncbi:MAG: DUF2845 domain-containing protein [Gammaproteobacteria bacterium]|nr:DUF2845 domain-containing protein [Gammaproteobacteria bacterium]